MKDAKKYIYIGFGAVLAIYAAIALVTVPMYVIESYSCTAYGKRMNLQSDYSLVNGCMVRIEGTYMPSKSVAAIVSRPPVL